MTLGDSERLPLPHTKGTKPAPSTVKVLVYLIQVKKYFLHENIGQIMKLIEPVKGLEPPLPCEKRILSLRQTTTDDTPQRVTAIISMVCSIASVAVCG